MYWPRCWAIRGDRLQARVQANIKNVILTEVPFVL
jgi:hypothetical protein